MRPRRGGNDATTDSISSAMQAAIDYCERRNSKSKYFGFFNKSSQGMSVKLASLKELKGNFDLYPSLENAQAFLKRAGQHRRKPAIGKTRSKRIFMRHAGKTMDELKKTSPKSGKSNTGRD